MIFVFIKNGHTDDTLAKYPYVVGIGYVEKGKAIYSCTGILIHDDWVLSAGDCLEVDRKYFVAITRNDNGSISVTKIEKIIDRQLKYHFDYEMDHSTYIGLLRMAPSPPRNILYPTLVSTFIRQYDMRFVYLEYLPGNQDGSETNYIKTVKFISTGCLKEFVTTVYICVLDDKGVLGKNYGGALLHKDTFLVGLFAADVVDMNLKRFIAIRPFYKWITSRINSRT